MRPWHKPIFFAQGSNLQRERERVGQGSVKGGWKVEGNVPKESTSQKLPRAYNEGDTRRAFVCSVCLSVRPSALSVVVCRCCCCHFKLPIIDEFAKIQTDRQRQRQRQRDRGLWLSLSGSRQHDEEVLPRNRSGSWSWACPCQYSPT